MRKYSEARKDSNRKWDSNNLDRMSYTVPKGHRATVQAAADKAGESINLYTQRALLARMGLESWTANDNIREETYSSTFRCSQKPMSLEDVKRHLDSGSMRPLRIEYNRAVYGENNSIHSCNPWLDYASVNFRIVQDAYRHEYNKIYRFWWEEPSKEDMASCEWENGD